MRIPIVAGNWKMNLTSDQGARLVEGIRRGLPYPGRVEVVVAPPFLLLAALAALLKSSYIALAAQNLHQEEAGAFTGECSAAQVRDAGAEYAIIGHSERRQYCQEDDSQINRKVHISYRHGLTPILCLGETLQQRERGEQEEVIARQLVHGLDGLSVEQAARLVVAYEPVWAIGTGRSASPAQVQEVHAFLRKLLSERFGAQASGRVRILYGGSVKSDNCAQILSLADVDGALVGGASLRAEEFIAIIRSVQDKPARP